MIHKQRMLAFVLAIVNISISWAQKEPQYTQYMYNVGSFNPAYVGSVEHLDFSLLYRAQWIEVPGAPTTGRFGVNYPFENKKMGLGFNVVNDELGPLNQTYVDIAYSYQVNLNDAARLSFGVDVGGSFLNIDYTKGNFENPADPSAVGGQFNGFYPTIGAGLFLYDEDWYVGASVPNFLTNGIYNDEIGSVVEDKIQYNLIGGYVFELSEEVLFKPALLFNYLEGAPINLNLSANFQFAELVTLGASYRIDNAMSGLAGIQISNSIFFGYSYDYNTNGFGQYNNGSHEAILKFYLGREGRDRSGSSKNKRFKGKPKQIDSPRFF
ncbi:MULTISPECIES: type IX secretion system membrane protein PorP/SprF [Flavobacteriaceae]|uniref:PorP/SprF family type IX secretion system membrane protein n=1 Tax=Flavobacteriaceae TaxID=49546 RepID=UPI0010AE8B8E|nr:MULTISPECIES: type IX secretion system membrane protein PorP/SprF [Flavobacteriaceae]NJB36197.1 type IX secretion system membrane protein PorP/SprF [Croceivirga sp. JEA036]TKD66666.1 type IX secretion system membrane protein PorP/SprF [Flavobacterium sp. ASW18X]